jgi:hypothetical protein
MQSKPSALRIGKRNNSYDSSNRGFLPPFSRTERICSIPRCQEWGRGSREERNRTLEGGGCERPRGRRSAGSRASLAVAGTGRGGGGWRSPVGEAAAFCRGGGVCGLNGLELRLGRVIPVEVVVIAVARDGRDGGRAGAGMHGHRARPERGGAFSFLGEK